MGRRWPAPVATYLPVVALPVDPVDLSTRVVRGLRALAIFATDDETKRPVLALRLTRALAACFWAELTCTVLPLLTARLLVVLVWLR